MLSGPGVVLVLEVFSADSRVNGDSMGSSMSASLSSMASLILVSRRVVGICGKKRFPALTASSSSGMRSRSDTVPEFDRQLGHLLYSASFEGVPQLRQSGARVEKGAASFTPVYL